MHTDRFPRRVLLFGALLLLLIPFGLVPLLFSWRGESGRPPSHRLYVPGDFSGDVLLALRRAPGATGERCYLVSGPDGSAVPRRACAGERIREWVGDAELEVAVTPQGVPLASLSGARFLPGDWIGSNADPETEDRVRFPFRGYGVPGRAARVVACPESPRGAASPVGCVQVHDQLGRLALARARGLGPGDDRPLRPGRVYPLHAGDELWLGLVVFAVRRPPAGDSGVVLARLDRVRPDTAARRTAPATLVGGGGDRRWLGRLWAAEGPDRDGALPDRFEVRPARQLFSKGNLVRRRTSLEAEDVVQALVDAELLCLDGGTDSAHVAWRSLSRPGCAAPPAGRTTRAVDRDLAHNYRRARWGDLARTVGSLVGLSNEFLAGRGYLVDATALPLAFDWRMRRWAVGERGGVGVQDAQPAARALWGVRFGATRFTARSQEAAPLPEVFLRTSTARHVVEVLRGGDVLASFSLGRSSPGALCLGATGGTRRLTPSSGRHHPLGMVAFERDPRDASWSPDPDAACGGCRLEMAPARNGTVVFRASGRCPGLYAHDGTALAGRTDTLRSGEWLTWDTQGLRFRVMDRGERAWAAQGRSGHRRFVEEFYRRAGLGPLLGGPGGLRGVEAALAELAATDARDSLASVELTVDGDLQLAVQSIVDTLAAGIAPPEDGSAVSVVVLDTHSAEVLAAANSRGGRVVPVQLPSAWEAGAQLTRGLENTAFQRRRPLGSTLKVVGVYALVNGGLPAGPALTRAAGGRAVLESRHQDTALIFLGREQPGGRTTASPRRCFAGTLGAGHTLPATDAALNQGTLVQRFAESCNSFFILAGFRHTSDEPAHLRPLRRTDGPLTPGELGMWVERPESTILVLPAGETLADRIRAGLAADLGGRGATAPRSIYGLLVRSGFKPAPGRGRGEESATFEFGHAGRRVSIPLAAWFGADSAGVLPGLLPGRDFAYPRVPSPGRLDARTVRGAPAVERLGESTVAVRRGELEGSADVQFSRLLIGQGEVEGSALALSVLYAPAARPDGRTVRPCLFRAACAAGRQGPPVVDRASSAAPALDSALRAVVSRGTASRAIPLARRSELLAGWGGKTGTYEQVVSGWPAWLGPRERWEDFRAHACGVEGAPVRPDVAALAGALRARWAPAADALARLAAAPAGAAWGARTCEDPDAPQNPSGIHGYGNAPAVQELDAVAEAVRQARGGTPRSTEAHHAMVLAALGGSGRARGILVAVLVDSERNVAVPIASEVAGAVERWAELSSR